MRSVIRPVLSRLTAFAVAVIVFVGAANLAFGAEAGTPAEFLEGFGAQAIKVLSETQPGEAKRDAEMRGLLSEGFDIDFIGRFVLSRYWRTASDAERADFRQLFEDYLIAAYGRRFGTYSGEKFVVGQTFPQEGGRAIVRTDVVRASGDTVTVDWRVQRRADGQWRVVDIMVEGVSMMLTQRSEFTALIQHEGGSVSALNEKLRVLTANLNDQPRKS
jgi:phospholipid transport system substrate-binding protein